MYLSPQSCRKSQALQKCKHALSLGEKPLRLSLTEAALTSTVRLLEHRNSGPSPVSTLLAVFFFMKNDADIKFRASNLTSISGGGMRHDYLGKLGSQENNILGFPSPDLGLGLYLFGRLVAFCHDNIIEIHCIA